MKEIAGYTAEDWEKIEKEYESDRKNARNYIKSYEEMINEILKGENYFNFQIKTGLSRNMFYTVKKSRNGVNPPALKTLISICVGYNLDINVAQELLKSLGVKFNPHKDRDLAYTFLLTQCRGKDVDECNEILKALGVPKREWLGSRTRKK